MMNNSHNNKNQSKYFDKTSPHQAQRSLSPLIDNISKQVTCFSPIDLAINSTFAGLSTSEEINCISKPSFGPKIRISRISNSQIIGDKILKQVNFEDQHCLCQFIQVSPPTSFRKETTELFLDLNDF